MRTNGFIFIALGFTAACMAGSPGYLPGVGPVGLRFAPPTAPSRIVVLPEPATHSDAPHETTTRLDVAELPVETPPNPAPPSTALMLDVPVVLPEAVTGSTTNEALPLISPLMDTNNVVTPQMFLRFFTPAQGGASREAIIIPPPGFSPARPPTPSSTATYTQPKP